MDERIIVIVNLKLHFEALENISEFINSVVEVANEYTNFRLVVAVPAFSLDKTVQLAADSNLEIWTQHLDTDAWGSKTGSLSSAHASSLGSKGTLLNHAEKPVSREHILDIMSGLSRPQNICVCAADSETSKEFAELLPEFLAVEPPELIGGDISVTSAEPRIVSDTVSLVSEVSSDVRVLCGAGVKTSEDLRIAIELGARGVLLASGITKADNPGAALKSLLDGL